MEMLAQDPFDDRLLGHLKWMLGNDKIGTRTWKLAMRHNCSVRYMRDQLKRLEKAGRVRRVARYSAVNDLFWQFVK